MIRLNARWIGFVVTTAMVACSGTVTVGSNAPSSDASAGGDEAPIDPCAGQPVPLLACNPGPTALTCNTSVSPPRWDVVCPGTVRDAGTCDGLGVPAIACNPGPGQAVCNTSVSPPRWDIVCPGPARDAGSPCDGLGVIAIGCASGQPTYACNTSGPSPRWDVTCPAPDGCCPAGYQLSATRDSCVGPPPPCVGTACPAPPKVPSMCADATAIVPPTQDCCPSGFQLSGNACVVTCAAGQVCPALAVQPHCPDAGASDGAVSASDAMPPPDTGICCPVGWLNYSCQYPDGGAGFACHNPALGCASSTTCGLGCDLVVSGPCGP